MRIFRKNAQVESMKTICHVLDSAAFFIKPEIFAEVFVSYSKSDIPSLGSDT